jgi:hypothetical protein
VSTETTGSRRKFDAKTRVIAEANERVRWALDNLDLDAEARQRLAKVIEQAVLS